LKNKETETEPTKQEEIKSIPITEVMRIAELILKETVSQCKGNAIATELALYMAWQSIGKHTTITQTIKIMEEHKKGAVENGNPNDNTNPESTTESRNLG